VTHLLGAYSHETESLIQCLKNYSKSEMNLLNSALRVMEKAAIPFHKACRRKLPSIAWASMINVYNVCDNISWERLHSFGGEYGLHYKHKCTFGVGNTGCLLGMYRADKAALDDRTCNVELDLYTQSPHFRGLASIQNLDIAEVRETMRVKIFIRVGDHVVSDTALVGGGISLQDLEVDQYEVMQGLARSLGVEVTPGFASDFTRMVYLMLMTLVGNKMGVSAHSVLSKLIFIESDHFDNGSSYARKFIDTDDCGILSDGSESSENECCDGRWYAVEHASRNAKIAKMIFEYATDPEDMWGIIRFHLGASEISDFRHSTDMVVMAADFYESARSDSKLKAMPWVDTLSISNLKVFVDNEVKGSTECNFRCDFKIGTSRSSFECSLNLDGAFSRSSEKDKFYSWRRDGKERYERRNQWEMSLHVDGRSTKPIRGGGKIDENDLLNLVDYSAAYLRSICHDLCPGSSMEEFAVHFASVLWELIKGTTGHNSEFGQLTLRSNTKATADHLNMFSIVDYKEKKRASRSSSMGNSHEDVASPLERHRWRTFSHKS